MSNIDSFKGKDDIQDLQNLDSTKGKDPLGFNILEKLFLSFLHSCISGLETVLKEVDKEIKSISIQTHTHMIPPQGKIIPKKTGTLIQIR